MKDLDYFVLFVKNLLKIMKSMPEGWVHQVQIVGVVDAYAQKIGSHCAVFIIHKSGNKDEKPFLEQWVSKTSSKEPNSITFNDVVKKRDVLKKGENGDWQGYFKTFGMD